MALSILEELGNFARSHQMPYHVLLELTYGCNLRCVMCYNPTHVANGELTLEEYEVLFDDLMADPSGWFTVVGVMVLGLLALLPIGMAIGAAVPGVQKVGMWGMFPVMTLAAISGIFYPVQALWGWVQVVAQVFPMYWLGLGMRSAFLPDSYAAAEIGGSWRTLETVAVLGVWVVVGALVAPALLRRMARRQSGSQVAAAREAATQWVK